jgi:hypothetical protein
LRDAQRGGTTVIDIDAFTIAIARAANEVLPAHTWHVGALAPSDEDPRWTIVVRTSPLVAPVICVRSPRLLAGLFDLAARVLALAVDRRADGAGLRELADLVNEVARSGDLSRAA